MDELRLHGDLSRDVLTFDIWNDSAIPTKNCRSSKRSESKAEQNKTERWTYSDFTATSAGIWRLTYGTTTPFLCGVHWWLKRHEMKANNVHLLRLHRDFCRDLAFDVRNDDAIPVEFPSG